MNRDDLETFPTQSGVYLMKDEAGTILYIGKAKNLRQRIRQYFLPRGDGRLIVPLLIARVKTIDTIIVSNEKEALLLENTLIKQHQPHYNALLKDDKTYIALKVNDKHRWPMVSLVRYKGSPKPGAQYFGPYTGAVSARQTLDLLHRLFPLRQCSDQELARRTRPCILYDMKRCVAPCVNKCTKEEYDGLVKRTIKFLRGQDSEILNELYDEMYKASEELDFEKAGMILQTIRHIEKTLEEQKVAKPLGIDTDVLAIFREGDEVILTQMIFHGGKLTGSRNFDFTEIAEEDDELLATFMLQHYSKQEELPREILLPILPADAEAIEEILAGGKRRVQLIAPQRGEKKALVEMAFDNAKAIFRKEKDIQSIREKVLMEMQDRFHLSHYPSRIECFDNSTITHGETVSTLVAFLDGVKDTSRYRKYKVRTISGTDDYGAMREVLERRYKKAKEDDDLPDLLIVDGGKGHLNVALKVMADLNIVSMDVISIAKEAGRHDKGMTAEQVYLPNIKDPILLRSNSQLLFLLQQIRDEAHRTAITFYRKRQAKKNLRSAIRDIPGIGPVKQKLLLTHFGSLKRVLEASEEDLKAVAGLTKANIKAILEAQMGGRH